MKDTAKDNEDKNNDLDLILNNVNINDESYDSKNTGHYANDGSIDEHEYNHIRQNDGDDQEEKNLSITIDSLKTKSEDFNLDDLNYSRSDIEPIDDISVFNNDDELLETVNEIEEDKKDKKKKLDNDEFNFMVGGMLDDLLKYPESKPEEKKEGDGEDKKEENKEDKIEDKEKDDKDDKEKIQDAVNVIRQLNKEDQIKTINAMKNVAGEDPKKKELVKNVQNKMKKIWDTKKWINNI
jgi:hypothetical protein